MTTEALKMVLLDSRSTVGSALMFWAEQGGYTSNIRKAEIFSVDKARAQHQSRESDIPMRLDYLEGRKERMVDCQYLQSELRIDTVEALSSFTAEARFYAVVAKRWDGNAVYFVTRDGEASTDVDQARLLTCEEARLMVELRSHNIWPQEHIEALAYWRIPQPKVSRKAALKDTGIELIKPQRVQQIWRCDSCGRFCSVATYYSQSCSCATRDY